MFLLAAPALLVAVQFVMLAANKPPEYARFALVLDVALLVAAFAALGRLRHRVPRAAAALLLVAFTGFAGFAYLRGFVRDCRPVTSRLEAAERLRSLAQVGARSIRLPAEPAPYIVPPADLFQYQLILPPLGQPAVADVSLNLDPRARPDAMSWADVRFAIFSPMERLRSGLTRHASQVTRDAPATSAAPRE